eukprot:289852_1
MSTKKMPYIRMIFDAIEYTKAGRKGASRAAIANYIKNNFDSLAEGSRFNTALRKALNDGITRGVLIKGDTAQRYKITNLGKDEMNESNPSTKYVEKKKKKVKPKSKSKSKKKFK